MKARADRRMVVSGITLKTTEGYTELSARVNCRRADMDDTLIWYRAPEQFEGYMSERADPFLASMLLPAIYFKCPLVIEGKVSRVLLERCTQIMQLFNRWQYEYRPVEIIPEEVVESRERGSETGCFFSGGLDSFSMLLKNHEREQGENRIRHLIHVEQHTGRCKIKENLAEIADNLGVKPLRVATNLKDYTPYGVDWIMYHGFVYAGVMFSLGTFFRKVYMASTYTYATAYPQSTHPQVDPLWWNGSVELIHAGCEATRAEKTVCHIVKSETALKHLQVCLHTYSHNCGKCRKCLFTMLMLDLAGALGKAEAFNAPVSYDKVSKLDVNQPMNSVCIDDVMSTFGKGQEGSRSYQAVLEMNRKKRRHAWLDRFKNRDGRYYIEAIHSLKNRYIKQPIREMDRRYLGSFLRKRLGKG